MFLELISDNFNAILTGFFTLAAALGTQYFQNSSSVIRKKTREELLQKFKLNSMINVMKGTKDLKSAVSKLCTLTEHIVFDLLNQIKEQNYSQIDDFVGIARNKFFKDSKMFKEEIDEFVFLISIDMLFNKEIEGEYKLIKKRIPEIRNIRKEMIDAIIKIKDSEINDENINETWEKFNIEVDEIKERIPKILGPLLFAYKMKIKREQQNLFKKLWSDLRYGKKHYIYEDKKESRLQDEPQG